MSFTPNLYKSVMPLDMDRHRKLRLLPQTDYRYADKTGAIPIVAGEFVDCAREYPIVFARDTDGNLIAAAMLGARGEENLFIDRMGRWEARYVPAFIRRYPFIFGEHDDLLMLCIDETSAIFSEIEGEPLFEEDGSPSITLQKVLNLLHEYRRQIAMTRAFVAKLEAHHLLTESRMQTRLPDGRTASLDGFLMVSEAALKKIPSDEVMAWMNSGELTLIYAHLFSLGNFIELAHRQKPPTTRRTTVRRVNTRPLAGANNHS